MADSSKAVFLSYASQDAEAAKKICDALRAAGVEVWFDQSELRGGDTWDQKIRKQIKECTLFLPIVSASTQARREGYFRLEWKLADDRTHLMARGTPFLVPVCIDDTKDWDALVPDSFMNVQWTRLPAGETTPKFCERVVQLLAGDTTPPMPVKPRPVPSAELAPAEKKSPPWLTAVIVVVPLLVGLVLAWRVLPMGRGSPPTNPAPASAASGAASVPVWPRDPELRRAVTLLDGIEAGSEEFALAEEIANKALAKNSTDPEAVTVMARVQVSYLLRGFDRSDERRATARRYAERAVQLTPDEPEALAALGVFNIQRAANLDLARELLEKAIRLRPDEPYYYRHRDNVLFSDTRVPAAEAIAAAEATAAKFPRDALAQYELARHYRDLGRVEDCERAIDRTLALAPVANAISWKSRIALSVRGDFAETKALLDRIPPRMRAHERVVISRWFYAIAGTDRDDGFDALQSLTSSWIEDFYFVGPKALLMAMLLDAAGKRELARIHYDSALTEIRSRQARAPADLNLRNGETWALIGLGRLEEAHTAQRIAMESVRRPYRYDPFGNWWLSVIPRTLLLGDRVAALELIREAVNGAITSPSGRLPSVGTDTGEGLAAESARISSRAAIRLAMKQDVRMAPFRDDPEIAALLVEPKAAVTAAPAAAPSPGRELANKALDLIQSIDGTREDFALAEEFCQRALKLDSTDGEIWAIYSEVHAAFAYRGWDRTPERREQTRVTAERAIRLAPTSVLARMAQAGAWSAFNINRAETEKLLRDIVREQPDNKMALKFLAVTVLNGGNLNECLALNERAAALPGGDPLALFNNARYLWQNDRSAEAYAMLARSLAQKPEFSSALVLKTNIEIFWKGDLAAAEATLKHIPQSSLLEDRANYTAGLVHYYERRADAALATWGAFPRDSYSDFAFNGPKGMLIGLADELDHRDAAAKIEWRAALQVVEKKIAAAPNNAIQHGHKAYLLACLGEKAAAEEELRTSEQLAGVKLAPGSPLSFNQSLLYVRLGRVDDFFAHPPAVDVACLRIDPRFDGIRADPRFEKLLAEYQRLQAASKK